MSNRSVWKNYIGQHIQCHTHFGTFQGVVVHLTKHHIILGRVPVSREQVDFNPIVIGMEDGRPFGFGPMGGGPGPGNPGPGGRWHMAIPLAAILGITAVGMHWW